MAHRLEVLARQLTLSGEGDSLAALCPNKLAPLLVHDNGELRAAIFEFLKVRGS